MRIYATLKGVRKVEIDKKYAGIRLIWQDLVNDASISITGEFISNKTKPLERIPLKLGNRYSLECEISENEIKKIKTASKVQKNKLCPMIRKRGESYLFIKGKYKGIMHDKIDNSELQEYLVWLAKNTNNETTVKNSLLILGMLN